MTNEVKGALPTGNTGHSLSVPNVGPAIAADSKIFGKAASGVKAPAEN